jgi:hypothetical protein
VLILLILYIKVGKKNTEEAQGLADIPSLVHPSSSLME